jgi:hypothetical protein
MSAKYLGRPSYASRARRNGELSYKSNQSTLTAITKRIDALSPNEFTIIEPHEQMQILESSIRNRISRANRLKHTNLKFHKDTSTKRNPNPNWYVWNCPDSRKFNRHGQVIDPTKPKQPKPSSPLSSGSIHATTEQVCNKLGINQTAFDALPFDQQMKLRIQVGIALRDQRTKLSKLNQIFKPPTKPPTNIVGN